MLDATDWKRKEFSIQGGEQYNEFNYFFGHVREILYDLSAELRDESCEGNKELINHFEFDKSKIADWYYVIGNVTEWEENKNKTDELPNKKVPKNVETFFLTLDSILLNIYSTGVAVLSFHLRNFKYADPDEILRINQLGRRLYPPHFGLSNTSVITGIQDKTSFQDGLDDTKSNELPHFISLGTYDGFRTSGFYEDFQSYTDAKNIERGVFQIPAFINALFPVGFLGVGRKSAKTNQRANRLAFEVSVDPILDSRMHLVCWYANSKVFKRLRDYFNIGLNAWSNKAHDWWYKYVFVDNAGFITCWNLEMKNSLVQQATYKRWLELGTLFGVSRYSFVMFTEDRVPLYLVRHLQTMYYKMAELCLVQRATVINYADEVTHVSHLLLDSSQGDLTLEKIATLYKKYLVFINKIYFNEVTPQEQGIELYDMMHRQMRIREDVMALDKQIEELHNYSAFEKNEKGNSLLATISIIGAVFLPLGFVASLMEWHVLEDDFLRGGAFSGPFWSRIGVVIFISVLMVLVMDVLTKFKYKSKHRRYHTAIRVVFYFTFMALGIYLIWSFI
ncbi:CorA family divalent cation transporter [Lunatimonas sp.]|uniref:CorA family divalent cation transporter n=1 Tax=Lunatimonas sp. TaxID=2060141 RepID=UPI00263A7488|nr:CorA family divalent cation transporter [Lunatimonas sp.]